jgi:hypothetical protein
LSIGKLCNAIIHLIRPSATFPSRGRQGILEHSALKGKARDIGTQRPQGEGKEISTGKKTADAGVFTGVCHIQKR